MLPYLLGFISLILIYLSYSFYWKPKAEMKRYQKLLQGLGYKVYVYPFMLTQNSYSSTEKQYVLKHKDAMHKWKHEMKECDFVLFNILNRIVISVINLDILKEMFSPEKVDTYSKISTTFKGTSSLLGEGLLFSEGDNWRRKRKIISRLFTFDIILSNIDKMCQICDKMLDEAEKQGKINDKEVKFNVKYMGSRIFSSVVLQCFLGVDDFSQKIKDESLATFVVKLLVDIGKVSNSFSILLFGKYAYQFGMTKTIKEVNQRCQSYKSVCNSIITERKKAILGKIQGKTRQTCTDILEALMFEGMNKQNQDGKLTDKELFEELSVFILAGTDTTSGLLQIMIYFLGENPQVQAKLREVINEVIKSDADFTYENLKKLKYIDWIQRESLRLGGPVLGVLVRKANKDHLLGNIPISKETGFMVNGLPNQFSQKYFKNAEAFRPQRWESECNNLPAFASFEFSGGPRNCIGKHLALIESKISLVKMMKRYKQIKLPEEQKVMVRTFMYEPIPAEITFVKSQSN